MVVDHKGPARLEIPLSLVLASPLSALAAEAHPLHAPVLAEIRSRVKHLLADLGIPGQAVVSLRGAEAGDQSLVGLAVHDQVCSLEGDPAWQAAQSLAGDAVRRPEQLLPWLETGLNQPPAQAALLVEFLAETCLEILRDQPEMLVGAAQAAEIAGQLSSPPRRKGEPAVVWPPDPETLRPVLQAVTRLGISLADRRTLARVLAQGMAEGSSPARMAEQAAGLLAPDRIAILLPAARFRELTLAWEGQGPEKFSQMRIRLARELGLNLPPFELAPAEVLSGDRFAFRIHHLASRPASRGDLDGVLEALEGEIRRRLSRLVLLPGIEAQLGLVDGDLRAMVIEFFRMPDLVLLLREWVERGQTLRPLPQILEMLIDTRFLEAGAAGALALKPILTA